MPHGKYENTNEVSSLTVDTGNPKNENEQSNMISFNVDNNNNNNNENQQEQSQESPRDIPNSTSPLSINSRDEKYSIITGEDHSLKNNYESNNTTKYNSVIHNNDNNNNNNNKNNNNYGTMSHSNGENIEHRDSPEDIDSSHEKTESQLLISGNEGYQGIAGEDPDEGEADSDFTPYPHQAEDFENDEEDRFDDYEKRNKRRFIRWLSRLHITPANWKKAYRWAGISKTVTLVLFMLIGAFMFCWYPSRPELNDPIENFYAIDDKHVAHSHIGGDPGGNGIVFLRLDTQPIQSENLTLKLQYLYSSTYKPPSNEHPDDSSASASQATQPFQGKLKSHLLLTSMKNRFALKKNDKQEDLVSQEENWRTWAAHQWDLGEFPLENGVEFTFNAPPSSYDEFLKKNVTVDPRIHLLRYEHKNYRYIRSSKPIFDINNNDNSINDNNNDSYDNEYSDTPSSFILQEEEEEEEEDGGHKNLFLRIQIESTSKTPIPVQLTGIARPQAAKQKVLFAALTLVGVYVLIVFELIHRTIAAMLGAFFAMSLLAVLDVRPSVKEMTQWIEYDTIFLLFGMMVMVGIFSTTGFFEWVAIKAYRISKGKILRLTFILCTFTAIISAFLDNVTTILLFVPVTIRLCKVLDISPIPLLIAEVVFSNIGGTATAVGDPPIVIIVSNTLLSHRGINFTNISLRLAPGVIIAAIVTFGLIRILQRKVFRQQANVSPERMNIKEEIEIWKSTYRRMRDNVPEEQHVREMLEDHIEDLERQLKQFDKNSGMANIQQLEEQYRITNFPLFISCAVVLSTVILLFFLQSLVDVRLNLAWISLMGSITMMLVSRVHDIEEVLEKVEWGTLLFFAGLFILMKALEELGLISFIGTHTADLIQSVDSPSGRLALAICILVWVSAFASAFIDNIPYTTAMIPVVVTLAEESNLPIKPLVWSLGFGACLGGNGTLIGASANVVCSGLAEQQGYPISFNKFFKTGFPVMLVTVLISNVYLLILHSWWKVDVPSNNN